MRKRIPFLLLAVCAVLIFGVPEMGQTAHNITLTWSASPTTGVDYNIKRATVSGGPYTTLNSAPLTALTFVDTTGVGGTTYFYVETAVCTSACPKGIGGESAPSNEVSATFLGVPQAGASLGATQN